MIAAIYARKSTEQNGVAEDARSTTRQIIRAREFAEGRGWLVGDEHVFVDDGISGAEFARRPGFLRLMNALKPRAPFQVLVMSEDSRLGREQIETAYALKQLAQAGVAVWGYLSGEQRKLETPTDKMMAALAGFASEMERANAAQRSRDALEQKARRGHVAGGSVYGYRNVPVFDGTRRSHVDRVVDQEQAAAVRRIFDMAANGAGVKRIATTLNDDGVTAPVPRRAGRPRGWAPSTIREILYRDLYRGRILWGRTKKRDAWGQKRQSDRAPDDWLRVDAPALQIVPDDVWSAVHERLAAARATYMRSTNGHAYGRPANGVDSPYLLTGLCSCGECGGGMFVHSRSHGRQRVPFFGCMTYHLRGRAVCTNNLEVPLEATDRAVLEAVEHRLLRAEVLETSLAKALELLRPNTEAAETRARVVRDELVKLDAEVQRLASAIATGGEMAALLVALQERERRRAQLRVELAALERMSACEAFDVDGVLDDLREQLTDWQGMIRQEAPKARPALTALLGGRLVFAPRGEGRDRFYEFSGPGTLDKVVAGIALPKGVVAPTGFEPVFQP